MWCSYRIIFKPNLLANISRIVAINIKTAHHRVPPKSNHMHKKLKVTKKSNVIVSGNKVLSFAQVV